MHRVGVLEEVGDDRVAHLVVRGDAPLLLAHHTGLLLGAGDHAHDPLLELEVIDLALADAGRQQRRLVHEVLQIGAGESGRLRSEVVEVDVLRQRLAARVHLEDLGAALAVGAVDHDLAVEAAGAQQGGVEDVGPVGGRDEDDVVLHLEAVHLDEQLVERLLALVVPAAHARAAVAADGVDLVHEDDAGAVLLRLLEEVTHTGGADADEHLDEVRAGDREERHACLAGHGAREQRLARSWRAVQQHALRYAGAERLEFLGVLEELLDLVQLLDGLVDPGDVPEGDLGRVDGHTFGARLAEGHDLRPAALHLVDDEQPEQQEDHERQDVGQRRDPAAAGLGLDRDRHVLGAQRVDEVLLGVVRIGGLVLLALTLLGGHVDAVVLRVERDALDPAIVDLGEELRVVGVLLLTAGADQLLGEEGEHHHDEDWECCALEESAHEGGLGMGAAAKKPSDR